MTERISPQMSIGRTTPVDSRWSKSSAMTSTLTRPAPEKPLLAKPMQKAEKTASDHWNGVKCGSMSGSEAFNPPPRWQVWIQPKGRVWESIRGFHSNCSDESHLGV